MKTTLSFVRSASRSRLSFASLVTLAAFAIACSDTGTSTGQGGSGGASKGATTASSSPMGSTGANPDVDADGDGFTPAQGDCNDADPSVHPGAVEICNDGKDDNCNGAVDASEPDMDGDGFGPCNGDCDDSNPDISPAAAEVAGDNIDNNCDGIVDADFDADGFTVADGDCDDANPAVYPGAPEQCFDGIDDNCDGFIDSAQPDADGDGYGPCNGDCDDADPNTHPGAPEIPNDGKDNNCDFLVDEDLDGDGWTVTNGDCDDNDPNVNPAVFEVCNDGVDNDCDGTVDTDCVTKCQLADFLKTSVGCQYFAVDTNNDPAEGYDSLPYAVVVSNTDPTDTATVQVQTKSGNVWTSIQTAAVMPGTLHEFDLPDRHVNHTNVNTGGAYRVISDVPIVAYQFQPIDGVNSFTSDASLLIPTSALDQFYYVAGWGEPSFGDAQINVVASQDNTQITVKTTVNTVAGGAVPAITSGTSYTLPQTFNAGDYVQIEANNGSFLGTYITANHPISVISAHTCANIPTQVCCCDHLEENLFGLQTWGKTYVASRHPVRSTGTPDPAIWHVLASQDQTSVSFEYTPGVTGLPPSPQMLNQGQALTLSVGGTTANPGDFIVHASKPVMVMQYMSSSANTNAPTALAGDPLMMQAVPVEQFLDHYVILIPVNWIYDRLVLTKPIGSTITMDGTPVAQSNFTVINDGVNPPQWEVARIPAGDGVHALTGTAPFGILVLGYDSYDSYGYPGGLNQQVINPVN